MPVSGAGSRVWVVVGLAVEMRSTAQSTGLADTHRCDRCGAQAYVQVEFADGDLLFCGHRARQHADKLREVALLIHDDTYCLGKVAPRWRTNLSHAGR